MRELPLILVVDDVPDNVDILQMRLESQGYGVASAGDGVEALEKTRELLPDLILLDIMIPKRDGYDVCQAVRANPAWSNVRILMLTAKGRDVERTKGLALGADDYVTKPFSTRELVDRVRHLLAR